MSYAADHLAWQQRVNQEFSAASRFMDRTYASKMHTGTGFGSSMGNPMGSGYPGISQSQTMYAPKRQSGYVAKSRLKDPSNASVRSKSMRSGMSRRSHLSRRKPTKRFNEDLDAMSRKSKISYQPSKASVKNYKPQVETQAVEQNKKVIREKLRNTFNVEGEDNKDELERGEPVEGEGEGEKEHQDLDDEIDSLYYASYTDSRKSGGSRRSQLTSATYISKLEKELAEERDARERLAKELEEIKKISSEISSHLGLKQAMETNN
mmetsp:Transcript_17430/g.15367  ORF Transcript_17430/g.15367 Transcript_17430/m.15367 type:complete len:264 (-) Transcript_17430:59-850(-)